MNSEDTQRVYEVAQAIADDFEHDHITLLGVWHEAERAPAEVLEQIDRAEHRVHAAVHLPVKSTDSYGGGMYGEEWYRPLISHARDEHDLQVENVSVKLGHSAQNHKVSEAPGETAEKANVDGLVEIAFAFPEDL